MTSFPGSPKRYDTVDTVPPPLTWALAALLCLFALACFLAGAAFERAQFAWYNGARIEHAAHGDAADAITVVALGDSRLRYGTLDGPEMRRLARGRGHDLRFVRIAHNGATFNDFAGVLPTILETRPDLVLVQTNVLFAERSAVQDDLAFFRRSIVRMARFDAPFRDQAAQQHDQSCPKLDDPGWRWDEDSLAAFTGEFDAYVWSAPDAPSLDRFRAFAARLDAEGIPLVLLQMRSLPMFEAHYYGPGRAFHGWMPERIGRAGDWPVWQQPDWLVSIDRYCDFAHLDEGGRRAFSVWLIDRIGSALRR